MGDFDHLEGHDPAGEEAVTERAPDAEAVPTVDVPENPAVEQKVK